MRHYCRIENSIVSLPEMNGGIDIMDIYDFLVSKDIAEHCRKIAHTFTSIEMACIVYYSHKTLQEKHEAWKQIIDTQSDMIVEERIWTPYCESLHLLLKDIMDVENKLVEVFRSEEQNVIYYHATCYDINGNIFTGEGNFQLTLDAIVKEIKNYNKEYCCEPSDAKIEKVRIKKEWVGTNRWIDAEVSKDGIILSISGGEFLLSDEENRVRESFSGIWFEVPTPFKKGDLVTIKSFYSAGYGEPFVLDRICYKQEENSELSTEAWQCWLEQHSAGWDWSDMIAFGLASNEDGTIYHDHFSDYLSMEYYRGELQEKNQILTAVSNYLKGYLDEELLLNVYGFMILQENIEPKYAHYREEYIEETLKEKGAQVEKELSQNDKCDDIYSFIPSVDIAAHCRSLSHEFSVTEQALIIYRSDKTMKERHEAWQKIIDEFSDEEVYECKGTKYEELLLESLHDYLKSYMQLENKMVKRIKRMDAKAVYNYKISTYYGDGENDYYAGEILFDTFDKTINAMKKEIKEEDEDNKIKGRCLYIQKQWLGTDKKFSVRVDEEGEIIGKWGGSLMHSDIDDIYHHFDHINLYVPVPFKKGDILSYEYGAPFLLEDENWEYVKADSKSGKMYLAEGRISSSIPSYSMEYGENVYGNFDLASLRIRHYRGKLKGLHRVLNVIRKHMKGEASVAVMMEMVDIIRCEERLKQARPRHYTEIGMVVAGLQERENNNETKASFNL